MACVGHFLNGSLSGSFDLGHRDNRWRTLHLSRGIVLGDDAYGITEVEGGGLKHIIKQLGSAGTADALDQRATVGWKAVKTAERLVENYMVRIESCASTNGKAN